MLTEQTPAAPVADPVAPIAPVVPETPAPAAKSELQLHRDKKAAAASGETVAAAPVVEVKPEPVKPEIPAEHLIVDEDGERYDGRTRAGKRIKQLSGIAKSLEARVHELMRQPAPPVAPVEPQKPSQPVAAVPDPSDPEPQLDQFADKADPYVAYIAALSRWNARQENKSLEAKRADADRASQQLKSREDAQKKWDEKMPAVKQRYADFDAKWDAFYDALAPFAQPIVVNGEQKPGRHRYLINHLLQSEHGHDLAYYLGTHPDDVKALFTGKNYNEHVLAIGRLEERVTASAKAPAAPASTPHPPVAPPMAPVGGVATVTTYDPATANLAQFRAHKARAGAGR